MPEEDQAQALLEFQLRNKEPHRKFNGPYAKDFFELETWKQRLGRARQEYLDDQSCCLVLYHRDQPQSEVVGTLNFTKFVRGRFQACYAGYSVCHQYEGQGLMSEALTAGVKFVFEVLRFHRIMANYVPYNERSGRLLDRLGFVKEGYAKDYLFVAGGWSDHVLTALTNPNPEAPSI